MNPLWDIGTTAGMEQSQRWFQDMMRCIKDDGFWGIPRSLSCYRVNNTNKTLELHVGNGDEPVERVAESLGWTVIKNQNERTETWKTK